MKPLFEYHQAPMTEHQQKVIIMLSQPHVAERIKMDILNVAPKPWGILDGALKMHDIKVSDELKLFIVLGLTPPSPGAIMLYVHALFHIRKLGNITHPLTMIDFCTRFSEGFPDEATMEKAWDDQKLPKSGNEVDDIKSYE